MHIARAIFALHSDFATALQPGPVLAFGAIFASEAHDSHALNNRTMSVAWIRED